MLSNLVNMDYNASTGINNLGVGTGIENKALSPMHYSPLENSIIEPQLSQEAEDMPEAIHTPWGIWIHKRDPLHSIHQRYDTEHMIRSAKAAEDILHYAHYVPIIEGPDHEAAPISYGLSFEYDYSGGMELYAFTINQAHEDAEDIELTLGDKALSEEPLIMLDKDRVKIDNETNESEEQEETAHMLKAEISDKKNTLKNFNLAAEEQILRVIESLFKLKIITGLM